MNDEVSVYSGIRPEPTMSASWQSVIENIRSEKYRDNIEKCRLIKDPIEYRTQKTKLPSVTFAGVFSHRNNQNIVKPTGFIIPDLDHLPEMESVFQSLIQDENIWFVFRSPSNEGMKCGIRATGITSDEEHKIFYAAVERYFKDTYSIRIDPACKDISRLTFVSSDKDLFINPAPLMFDVPGWTRKPEQHFYHPVSTSNGWKSIYGNKVLETCCREIAESAKGQQHGTRLRKSRLIGGFIASGFIDELVALSELEQSVVLSGAVRVQDAMKTIQDGIRFGKAEPIYLEERPISAKPQDISFYCDPDECLDDVSNVTYVSDVSTCQQMSSDVSTCPQLSSIVSNCHHLSSDCHHVSAENEPKMTHRKPENLASYIKEWITNSDGSFTVDQIDREFCLTTRADKNNRAKCLSRYIEKKLIKKDKRIKGKYHTVNTNVEWIDLEQTTEESFNIRLPFDLHKNISVPQRGIIIITGSSNAGKTSLILNLMRLNLSQPYEKIYLMSEMIGPEYLGRIKAFGDSIDDWKCVKSASKSYDFGSIVSQHNPDGLTCIDFLEEIDGEYYRIASNIRDIYDSLGTGCAVIGIQKKKAGDYARGGEATSEKARLYMSIDNLVNFKNVTICALKIVKAKYYKTQNINNHEIHFKLVNGSHIEPITDWMPCQNLNREYYINQYSQPSFFEKKEDDTEYEKTIDDKGATSIYFVTKDGKEVRVIDRDVSKWQENFPKINVRQHLRDLSEQSKRVPFLDSGKYFFQLSANLKKHNTKELKTEF
jgi:hypothetical protein